MARSRADQDGWRAWLRGEGQPPGAEPAPEAKPEPEGKRPGDADAGKHGPVERDGREQVEAWLRGVPDDHWLPPAA